jgi:hypothetical protein
MVSLELLKDLGSLALVSGDDIGELFEQRLAHPVNSSLELLLGGEGLTDLCSPLGVPRQTTGRNPFRFVTAPVAHRLRARGAPCARQQGRPPSCVGGRKSSDCHRELGRGAGRAKVSNELSNYCSANRQPHLDDAGSFGAPGIGIADRLACFGMKRSTARSQLWSRSLRSPLFPTRYLALAGGLTRRIERRRTSVRRPAKRVDRNGALDRHDWLSACRSA